MLDLKILKVKNVHEYLFKVTLKNLILYEVSEKNGENNS